MEELLQKHITEALKSLDIEVGTIVLEHPADTSHGDYATSVALSHAKQSGKNPRELAESIVEGIGDIEEVEKVEIAGPGFINFYLKKDFFASAIAGILSCGKWGANTSLVGKKVMIEYTQPNPFKPFHIGHLMSNAIGESLSRIIEYSGAETLRANYQGDVGPHVAKAMWALLKKGKPEEDMPVLEQANYIGNCYVEGNAAYESDPEIKEEIDLLNKKIYEKTDEHVNVLYSWGREVTLTAFEALYKKLGTTFDYYFFESEMAPVGQKIVEENTGKVFEESDGAVIFPAELHDPKLHTRVFINSKGLPTYETKEIGLTVTKFEKESPDLSIVVTAQEQADYMRVVEKAISLLYPLYAQKMQHVSHGMMRFAEGKMSSRKGNVVTGESLINEAQKVVLEKIQERDFAEEEKEEIARQVGVAAVKYSVLKQALGGNIVYDFEKSISFEGDSGPYLQYTAVRARALLQKANTEGIELSLEMPEDWETTELEKYLYRFPEVVVRAHSELEPHHIATYLTELASLFNSFYGQGKIVEEGAGYKILLTQAFYITMQNGLELLGMEVPEKM